MRGSGRCVPVWQLVLGVRCGRGKRVGTIYGFDLLIYPDMMKTVRFADQRHFPMRSAVRLEGATPVYD